MNTNDIITINTEQNVTTQPQIEDTVYLYANSYVVTKYNESNKCMEFGFTGSVSKGNITLSDYINVKSKNMYTLENIYATDKNR